MVKLNSARLRRFSAVILGFTLALTACTLPTPVAPVQPEIVVLDLEPEATPDVVVPEPEPEPADPLQERIDGAIAGMDLRTQLAGLMVVTVSGMDAAVHQEFLDSGSGVGSRSTSTRTM